MNASIIKTSLLSLIAVGFLSACRQGSPDKKSTESRSQADAIEDTPTNPHETCYLRLEGPSSQDSTFVTLSIVNDTVTGKYNWIPFEKDRRTGRLSGIKRGDTIDVVWHFTQEGMQDTLHTVFLLQGDQLRQKPFRIDAQTGRQFTDNESTFSISYKKIDCEVSRSQSEPRPL
ncbi:hypothetical protein [Olivibacter sp. XZL3]|uniref:hypothetical protein n=1 Tax=Olivibacter sp. XZL3 TaxID=1735116 RepID=UPI0010664C84|nr:hypothetical protein [Olivibacter sp. XZL3]